MQQRTKTAVVVDPKVTALPGLVESRERFDNRVKLSYVLRDGLTISSGPVISPQSVRHFSVALKPEVTIDRVLDALELTFTKPNFDVWGMLKQFPGLVSIEEVSLDRGQRLTLAIDLARKD